MVAKPLWLHLPDENGALPPSPIPNPDLTPDEFTSGVQALVGINIGTLWQAAHDYEWRDISGSAVGLIVLGVLQNKPKCLDVQRWIQAIWALYYQRKHLVSAALDPVLLDFSSCGPCPWTVPELLAELGM